MSAPEVRVFSPEWHEKFNKGEWVTLGRESHEESWGDFHPRTVKVLYEEIMRISAGYSLHRKFLLGHVEFDVADEFRDSHSMINSISWTPKEETWSGEEETVVIRIREPQRAFLTVVASEGSSELGMDQEQARELSSLVPGS